MARFRIFLVGAQQPIEVDLPACDITALNLAASHARFLEGYLADADHDGVCPGVLIPTARLQMAVEM